MPSSQGCWNPVATEWESLHSRTGRHLTASRFLANHVLDFLYPQEIWIPWLTIIPYPKSDGRPMLTHPEVLWESGRIMRCVVYGNLIRQTYKKTPVILGGIEASLRRMAHYDYWSDKLKRSLLLDSECGYCFLTEWANTPSSRLQRHWHAGIPVEEISPIIDGTVVIRRRISAVCLRCRDPSLLLQELKADRLTYARELLHPVSLIRIHFQRKTTRRAVFDYLYVVQNPPALPLTEIEMDDVYALPYMRTCHPSYEAAGRSSGDLRRYSSA